MTSACEWDLGENEGMKRVEKLAQDFGDTDEAVNHRGGPRRGAEIAFQAGYCAALEDAAKRFDLAFERNEVVQDTLDAIRALANQEEA